MNRSFISLLLGFCALATTQAAARLIAPFYGAGPLLTSATLIVACAALALGLAASSSGESAPPPAIAPPLLGAAAWTLVTPWLAAPLLALLEHAGLRLAVAGAVPLLAGVPLVLLGVVLGRAARAAGSPRPIAVALLGAAIAAPLVARWAFPTLGVARTLVVVAALEVVAVWRGRSIAVGVALLALGAWTAVHFPAVARDPAHGLVAAWEGRAVPFRVVDREDGRFLIQNGGIRTLVSSETGDALLRPVAALQVVDLLFARPDSALVLGLAGGGSAKRLASAGWHVDVVEPDRDAVAAAVRFLSFRPAEVRLAIDDERRFARRSTRRYPLVILDVSGGVVPPHLVTREGLGALADRVTEDGVLALAVVTRGWNDPVLRSLAATLRARFDHVLALPTSEPPNALGSIVLLASNRVLAIPDERVPQPADYLMNPEEHWAVVQLTHAWFNRFEPPARGALALTDDRHLLDAWNDAVQLTAATELHRSFAKPPRSW